MASTNNCGMTGLKILGKIIIYDYVIIKLIDK